MWTLSKCFSFEAAHKLPHHSGKCSRLHGHSFQGVVYVQGDKLIESGSETGMVMDYQEIKKFLSPLIEDRLDHHFLNESLGLENPTAEEIARWIFTQLKTTGLTGLIAVEIKETCTSSCIYSERNLWLSRS